MKFLKWLLHWFISLFHRQDVAIPLYRYVFVEDRPDKTENYAVYVLGTKENPWQVAFHCPCQCGDVIELFTNKQARPRWDIEFEANGLVTLYPSVFRKQGCKSHFFLRNGRIEWCP